MNKLISLLAIVFIGALLTQAAQAETIRLDNKSERLMTFTTVPERIAVSDETILNAQMVDSQTLRLLGTGLGTSTLTVWEAGVPQTYNVVVTRPVSLVQRQLDSDDLTSPAEIVANGDKILLRGRFNDAASRDRAVNLTKYMIGDDVFDMTELSRDEIVQTDIRFVTISSSTLKSLGLQFGYLDHNFSTALVAPNSVRSFGFNQNGKTELELATSLPIANAFNLLIGSPEQGVLGIISALQGANLAHSLAEPKLMARSGETADFLVGGEIPIPVPQGTNGTVTIEYKKFGVKLNVTPTILPHRVIGLSVNPEVSELDFTNALVMDGFTVPALRTRSTKTSVDIPEGHTLVIAGLMMRSFGTNNENVPYLSELPILGELFQRNQDSQDELELIVTVTPHLVRPRNETGPMSPRMRSLMTMPVASPEDLSQRLSRINEPGLKP